MEKRTETKENVQTNHQNPLSVYPNLDQFVPLRSLMESLEDGEHRRALEHADIINKRKQGNVVFYTSFTLLIFLLGGSNYLLVLTTPTPLQEKFAFMVLQTFFGGIVGFFIGKKA